ncbi:MAG: hypothetical protein HYU99_10015 [Deltaproteobacteria bacterium]|nr:hypothetical protein [Deltaproteobacteria bacterium]
MPPKWLLVCATKPEWGELKKHLHFEKDHTFHGLNFYCAQTAKKEILLGQIGVGYEIAERKAHTIFHSFVNPPQLVIHFGLSGALKEGLKEGDLILPTCVVNPDKQSVAVSPDLIQKTKTLLQSLNFPFLEGNFFTSAKVLSSPTLKKKAGEEFDAIAVDMETYPLAKECQKAGIPFLSIRAIWDPLEWDLSALSETSFDHDGNLKRRHFLGNALAHPRLLLALPKYRSAIIKGNKAIARFLMEALEKWE